MKGIVLAGGNGSRLFPSTSAVSKQLLPVYDKPTIYYPLSTLMMAGIRDILIISTPRDLPMIKSLLRDGSQFGLSLSYREQPKPEGIAQAFIIGEEFVDDSPVCLILGDNLFHGDQLNRRLDKMTELNHGACVYAYHVQNPERYGVVDFDQNGIAVSIEEKPKQPKSNWAVTGLYFYDSKVVEYAKALKPSTRGELEITDLNKTYLRAGTLKVECLGRGVAWLDTGTEESLLVSAQFVQTIEKRQGLKIACLEEIAYYKDWISRSQLVNIVENMPHCGYSDYLRGVLDNPPTETSF